MPDSLSGEILPPVSAAEQEAHARRLRRIEQLEYWLDRRFRLPLFGSRVGFDGILGLVPGIGDTVSGALSAYLIWQAHQAGVSKRTKARMIGNAAFDYVLGLVPIVGSAADFFYRANTKNLRILKEHLARQGAVPGSVDQPKR